MEAGFLVEACAKMMEVLSYLDIRMTDYKYVHLWHEYERSVKKGEKASFIVVKMAQRHGISEASVYRVLRRFRQDVSNILSDVDSKV